MNDNEVPLIDNFPKDGTSLGLSRENVSKIIKIASLDYNTKSLARQNNYSNTLVLEKLVGIENSDYLLNAITV